MKFLFSLLLLISMNAFAVEVCSYDSTNAFHKSLRAQKIKPVRQVTDHKKFTSVEKQLIMRMVSALDGRSSLVEALETFGDYWNGKPGTNAGEILYYNVEGKQIVLVHYWPGDNEYGAFFTLNKNGSFKFAAEIHDGEIICK